MKRFRTLIILFLLQTTHVSFGQFADSLKQVERFYNRFQHPVLLPLSFSKYSLLLGRNIRDELTAPFHFHKKAWTKAAAVSLVTAGLMFADEPVQQTALRWRTNSKELRKTSEFISRFGARYEVYTFASLMSYGILFKNQKLKNTTLLGTQAYLTGGVIEVILKFLSGRERPWNFPANVEAEPVFHGPVFNLKDNGSAIRSYNSFPSGHTIAAFAAATVFAREYKDKALVPIIAYSAATLIGLSRITENAHWISDVFAGAAIGYFTGRLIVHNYHKLMHSYESSPVKNSISFDIQFNIDHAEPGICYHF